MDLAFLELSLNALVLVENCYASDADAQDIPSPLQQCNLFLVGHSFQSILAHLSSFLSTIGNCLLALVDFVPFRISYLLEKVKVTQLDQICIMIIIIV